MGTVQEIEAAIAQLPPDEFRQLMSRLEEQRAADWDRQMEEDAASGKLDRLYAELEKENAGQPEIPLDDFLDQSELPEKV